MVATPPKKLGSGASGDFPYGRMLRACALVYSRGFSEGGSLVRLFPWDYPNIWFDGNKVDQLLTHFEEFGEI